VKKVSGLKGRSKEERKEEAILGVSPSVRKKGVETSLNPAHRPDKVEGQGEGRERAPRTKKKRLKFDKVVSPGEGKELAKHLAILTGMST